MLQTLSTLFIIISIGLACVLVYAVFRLATRQKLVHRIRKLPSKARDAFIASEKRRMMLFGMFLFFSPILLGVLPLALYFFFRQLFLPGTIAMALLVVTCLQEFLFRRWLVGQLV